jgi:hypothetical protein
MGRFDDQLKLRTFVRLGNWIACDCRRKAALRADCEPVEVDEARCLVGSPLQNIEAFERRDLAADQAEHLTLVLCKTQRSEIAGALGVVGVLCRQAKPLMQNAGAGQVHQHLVIGDPRALIHRFKTVEKADDLLLVEEWD